MGRDLLGDDTPPETLYRVEDGADAGWPRCHAGTLVDPDFGQRPSPVDGKVGCDGVVAPGATFQAHAAPLGLAFWGDRAVTRSTARGTGRRRSATRSTGSRGQTVPRASPSRSRAASSMRSRPNRPAVRRGSWSGPMARSTCPTTRPASSTGSFAAAHAAGHRGRRSARGMMCHDRLHPAPGAPRRPPGPCPRGRADHRRVRHVRQHDLRRADGPCRLRLADRRPRARPRDRGGPPAPTPCHPAHVDRRARPRHLERAPAHRPDAGHGRRRVDDPRLETAAEAREAMSWLRYPPAGIRGVALGTRAPDSAKWGMPMWPPSASGCSACSRSSRRSPCGLPAKIAAIDGVDVLFVGPRRPVARDGDARSGSTEPAFLEALDAVVAACREHGKSAGILLRTADDVPEHLVRGFTFIGIGADWGYMTSAARASLKAARDAVGEPIDRVSRRPGGRSAGGGAPRRAPARTGRGSAR